MSRAEIQKISTSINGPKYPLIDSTNDSYDPNEQARMVGSFLNPANQEAETVLIGLVWLEKFGQGAVELARLEDGSVIVTHFGGQSDVYPYDSPEALAAIQSRMAQLLAGTDPILPGNRV